MARRHAATVGVALVRLVWTRPASWPKSATLVSFESVPADLNANAAPAAAVLATAAPTSTFCFVSIRLSLSQAAA